MTISAVYLVNIRMKPIAPNKANSLGQQKARPSFLVALLFVAGDLRRYTQEIVLEELSKIITLIITPIIIGFISAYIGSVLAIRKFKKEKLWERREKAYTEIIYALYDILQHLEIQKEDYG